MARKAEHRNSSFFKDSATLISGNVWAQVIALAAYFLLARLFSPSDFGLYNIFYSYIDVLIIVSTCKYELATVIADNDREAAAVSRLALRINAAISLALLTIVLLLYLLQTLLGGPRLLPLDASFALLIPPMVFFCGTSRVYASLFNRRHRFNAIALSEVAGSAGGVAAKLLFGLPRLAATAWHHIGLPLGTVLGKAASNINYLLRLRTLALPATTTREERRSAARKFRNFPLFTMPKDLLNSLSFNLPLLWLAVYFDKAEVGLYAMALTFTFRPVNIFNSAFERLLYVRITERVRNHQTIMPLIRKFILWLNAAAIPVFAVAFLFGDSIFAFLFGDKWSGCGFFIRCLLPWVYVSLTSASVVFLSNVFSRQRTEFVFYIILFALRLAAMVAGIATGSFRTGIMLFAASGALVSAALTLWALSLARSYERRESF